MTISLYIDENVHRGITNGLRIRGIIAKAASLEELINVVQYLPL